MDDLKREALEKRKANLEAQLSSYGIMDYKVNHLPYLDYSNERFQSEYEAGCRMMILFAISYSAENLGERPHIIQWFKDENGTEHSIGSVCLWALPNGTK